MKVVALDTGFYNGGPVAKGKEFDVPDGSKAAWYAPVKSAAKAAEPTKPTKPKKDEAKTLSEIGKEPAKSLNDALA